MFLAKYPVIIGTCKHLSGWRLCTSNRVVEIMASWTSSVLEGSSVLGSESRGCVMGLYDCAVPHGRGFHFADLQLRGPCATIECWDKSVLTAIVREQTWITLHHGRDGGQDGYSVPEKRWTVQHHTAQQRDGGNQTGAKCCAC
jgi:hypothetical protein